MGGGAVIHQNFNHRLKNASRPTETKYEEENMQPYMGFKQTKPIVKQGGGSRFEHLRTHHLKTLSEGFFAAFFLSNLWKDSASNNKRALLKAKQNVPSLLSNARHGAKKKCGPTGGWVLDNPGDWARGGGEGTN